MNQVDSDYMKLLMRDEYNLSPLRENFTLQKYKCQDLCWNTHRDIEHKKTEKYDVIPSNDITNGLDASNIKDVNLTVRKDLHNNQDNKRNKIRKMMSTVLTTVKTLRMNINQKNH